MPIRSSKELALLVTNQRKKLKLSQTAIGQLVGLKQKTISAFENKPGGTKLETLFLILSALNLNLEIVSKEKTITKAKEKKWEQEW